MNDALNPSDFAKLFGIKEKDLPSECLDFILNNDFSYENINKKDSELLSLKALKIIDSGALTISGVDKKQTWEKGWNENLNDYIQSKDTDSLIPKFVRRGKPVRIGGKKYIYPNHDDFETNFVTVLRLFLFKKHFKNLSTIYEFGCGTGLNLVALAKIFPDINLYGSDWSKSSIEILKLLKQRDGYNIRGHFFDMFHPDYSLNIDDKCGFLTIGAMEQLGKNYKDFLEFILHKEPRVIINIETMYELYDENSLFDYAPKRYLEVRNWLRGYYDSLKNLQKENKINIIDVQRPFGSFFHDGYSYIVWSPIN